MPDLWRLYGRHTCFWKTQCRGYNNFWISSVSFSDEIYLVFRKFEPSPKILCQFRVSWKSQRSNIYPWIKWHIWHCTRQTGPQSGSDSAPASMKQVPNNSHSLEMKHSPISDSKVPLLGILVPFLFFSSRMKCRMGIPKARVLPLPYK